MASSSRARTVWRWVRRIWATLGTVAFLIFTGWSLIAYRASSAARAATRSDARVTVTRDGDAWRFEPVGPASDVGLLFVPGALVDPIAYAPLLNATAAGGHRSILLTLPRRGAFGGATDPGIPDRVASIMRRPGAPSRWIIGGHSRGGVVATSLVHGSPGRFAGLVLIGTSHPRDVSLAEVRVPVMKIMGTRDGLASVEEVEGNRHLLPPHTQWVSVEGGNHSQFGWYGFQPGDRRATIPAAEQRRIMIRAVIAALDSAA
jgi:pimeloyl-ACP methyl ester carboxylesterase